MKKTTLFILAATFLVGGAVLSAAQGQFAGTWRLDPSKSSLGEMYGDIVPDITLVLAIEGNTLTLRRTVTVMGNERSSRAVLTMDGKECVNDGESFKGLKSTCKSDGVKMRIAGEREGARMTIEGGGEPQTDYFAYKFEEEYSLSADGKVLTVAQKMAMPDGEKSLTLVFNRA